MAPTDEAYYVPLVARAEHLGLVVKDGLVYSPGGLLYIPKDEAVRTTLLREVHDAPTGGHLGREKTYRRLTEHVYWQGVYEDVRDYVRSCVSCAQNKASNRTASDFLHPLPIPARRWETISLDFVGPLPKTSRGNDTMLTVVDKFSKQIHPHRLHAEGDGVRGSPAGVRWRRAPARLPGAHHQRQGLALHQPLLADAVEAVGHAVGDEHLVPSADGWADGETSTAWRRTS